MPRDPQRPTAAPPHMTPVATAFTVVVGLLAATLVPGIRRRIPRGVELTCWALLLPLAVVLFTTDVDPRVTRANTSISWGVFGIAVTQASFVLAAMGDWVSTNRFQIATWVVAFAGADAFALVLLHSHRAGAKAARVHLAEWFELPLPVAATMPAEDAVAELDRAIAARLRLSWKRMAPRAPRPPRRGIVPRHTPTAGARVVAGVRKPIALRLRVRPPLERRPFVRRNVQPAPAASRSTSSKKLSAAAAPAGSGRPPRR